MTRTDNIGLFCISLATSFVVACTSGEGSVEDETGSESTATGAATSATTDKPGTGGSTSTGSTGNGDPSSTATTDPGPTSGSTGPSDSTGGTSGTTTSSTTEGTTAAVDAVGLPCEVQKIVATQCQGCHDGPPQGALITHADLIVPSDDDPSHSVAEEVLLRIAVGATKPMPPPPFAALSEAEATILKGWIDAGLPQGSCANPTPPAADPYDTPTVCTTDTLWTGGDSESPLMRPGGECVSCHETDAPPMHALWLGGTVFATPHEPDDCNGVDGDVGGAVVVITEANGTVTELPINSAGNFFLEKPSNQFTFPYTAKVVYQGRERIMLTEQVDSGDCNHCHTLDGDEEAPGRIFLP
jgi:hypothetical protein